MDDATAFKGLESLADHAVRMVGSGIEIFTIHAASSVDRSGQALISILCLRRHLQQPRAIFARHLRVPRASSMSSKHAATSAPAIAVAHRFQSYSAFPFGKWVWSTLRTDAASLREALAEETTTCLIASRVADTSADT